MSHKPSLIQSTRSVQGALTADTRQLQKRATGPIRCHLMLCGSARIWRLAAEYRRLGLGQSQLILGDLVRVHHGAGFGERRQRL